jgi:cold shock CspA family protein
VAIERIERGEVAAFEADRGVGEVHLDDGRALFFHCAELADDSRHATVGTPVTCRVVAGRRGQWEAAAIEKLRSL